MLSVNGVGGVRVVGNKNISTGNVYDPEFIGPVEWKYFYRGDATKRSTFKSSLSMMKGQSFMDSLGRMSKTELYAEHGISSAMSPYVSTSSNKNVASFFAKGSSGTQAGHLTTFRVEARDAAEMQKTGVIVPNFENPMAFFEPNPLIGLPESEYLFLHEIDPKFIYSQSPIGGSK